MNDKILIRKLEKYGIYYQYIDCFKSYINRWKQYVCYSEVTIPLKEVTGGVPQNLVLVPLLSLIFADDFQPVKNFLKSVMFAAETNIVYSNVNIKELFENINKELANVPDWYVTNKLSINTSKINS